jgi:predicted MFS family arabinose efflux permease
MLPSTGPYPKVPSIVFLLGAASFVVVAVMTVTGPLLPLIAHDFGTSVGAAGIVVSAPSRCPTALSRWCSARSATAPASCA